MPDDILTDDIDTGADESPENAFLSEVERMFGKDDDARVDAEDGLEAGDEVEDEGEGSGTDAADGGAGEHTKVGTSAKGKPSRTKPDGASAESTEDSPVEGDDPEHPDDESDSDEGAEDDDDAEDADAEGEVEEEKEKEPGEDADEGLSDELQAAAARHAIPLTLEDVADPTAKKLVAQKLKAIDVSYTRAMQEARAYRAEEAELRADLKFRDENIELDIAERLAKDPTLIDRVQARLDKLEDPDAKEAFEIVVRDKRKQALDAMTAHMQQSERMETRIEEVETFTRQSAAAKGLPWQYAERAVSLALMAKPAEQRDITNAEIEQILAAEAKTFAHVTRNLKREKSKETIQSRSANKRPASPATTQTGSATTPRPARPKPVEVDDNDPEARVEALMEFARKAFPGKK